MSHKYTYSRSRPYYRRHPRLRIRLYLFFFRHIMLFFILFLVGIIL
jgi:hypothetical protein